MMKKKPLPSRSIDWVMLKIGKFGFITFDEERKVYLHHGHRRGTGRQKAVICWEDNNKKAAFDFLDAQVATHKHNLKCNPGYLC